jgi:hypothetical protein
LLSIINFAGKWHRNSVSHTGAATFAKTDSEFLSEDWYESCT